MSIAHWPSSMKMQYTCTICEKIIIINININELLYKIINILFCKRGYYVEPTYDHTLARRGAIMLVPR